MIVRISKLALGAALAIAAGSAGAQTPGTPRPIPRQPPATTPPITAAPGQPAAGQPALTEDARNTLATLHLRNAFEVDAGQLAQQQGGSQPVKDFGRTLEQDARRVDGELASLVRERGQDVATLPLPEHERAGHQQMMDRLRAVQGDAFDRELVRAAIDVEQRYVQDLKTMRNRTPGQDARLKKWLDDTENVAEAHLAAARALKRSQDGQRAARRPPGAP
ncbi:conserved hypothetical protein [Anaeromyxobacter dehalogenans 2CP-1]|uniref:DUF4142 domain-containing protein n=1 Tax=Anaeromyxobacter dehalogenans (strain ATCC BAA-258 / DSM 21875 / 2CP-1) TaxID=455488 RepID=B8JEF8_ANAD2|nr:DUF4142 domain-containing protein [Anaeromyxobacter dehalogenans]ACL64284.1 conserved hypothetical protein [Anaeromyxobacter dehalogenans 2CP-1]